MGTSETKSSRSPDHSADDDVIERIPLLSFLGMRVIDPPADDVYSVAMEITPSVTNLRGVPHGGAIAALIDHAGGHASGVLLGRGGPTADLHVRYLTIPRRSGSVRADARVVREGRRLVVVAVDVFDDEGRLLATGSLTVAPSPGRAEPPPD